MGNHVIKSWSNTQKVIALSSGEAEYYGLVRGASMGMGAKAILSDLGVGGEILLRTDASAAKGIAPRKGLGKERHIEVNQLWVQDKVESGETQTMKVGGDVNIADALTKSVDNERIKWQCQNTKQEIVGGRHTLMPLMGADGYTSQSCE